MKSIKEMLLSKAMKAIGFMALFAGILAIKPNSTFMSQQPKCFDEFLK